MRKFIPFLILVLFLFPALAPLLRNDFFHFSDEPNISLIYEMSRALKSGHFPPRWIPDVSYSYGHPLFNFYYPLPFMIAAVIFQITGSLVTSIKLYFLLTVIFSSWGMYLLLKKHTLSIISFFGSLIYVYTPYRAVDLYVRGAIGELTAFAISPFVCFFIFKLYEKKTLKNVGLLALFTAIFILSHNLALMVFFPWFFVYGFYLYLKDRKNIKFLKFFGLSMFLGILISFYWLFPAITEKNLLYSATPFNYQDHFPFLKQLFYSPLRYGASQPGPYDDISLQIGIANLLLVLVTTRYFIVSKKIIDKSFAFLCFSAFFLAVFLMNIRSNFLWEAFSLSTYFQFPWRILMFTTFLTAFMIVFVKSRLMAVFLFVISLINTFSYFVPSEYFNLEDNYYMKRMFANRVMEGLAEENPEYKNYSEDYLLLPKCVKVRPSNLPTAKIESESAKIESIKEITPYNYEAEIVSQANSEIKVNNYYFPGWSVYIDGKKANTYPLEPYGNIGFIAPEGKHSLKVMWEEIPLRKITNYLSLITLISTLAFIFVIPEKNS